MVKIADILAQMKRNPKDVRFQDLYRICDSYFGKARHAGSSHRIYKMPWQGDPRMNIQNHNGKAKVYQVRQALQAIERLEVENAFEK